MPAHSLVIPAEAGTQSKTKHPATPHITESSNIGEPPVNPWATARSRNTEFDEIVTEMSKIPATDPQTMELFEDAMEIRYEELPDIYVSQLIIRHVSNENYWEGWSSLDNIHV